MTKAAPPAQLGFDELEPLLSELTFVVVDLETTGTRPGVDEITELGAVRMRGGEIEAELSTFVAIDGQIPARITGLTGISPADLVGAPPIGEVLATFEEFARGAVLVAHNARFDMGFLAAAARACGRPWPARTVLCTLDLSRRILPKGETRSYRLADLAAHLGATTVPTHRALADVRATCDVLHALIARVGDCGVATLSDLKAYDNRLAPEVRRRSQLTATLPEGPGVYVFRDAGGAALYVGSSVSVRRRARSYYSGGDARTRMRLMATLAESVEGIACSHVLEAWTLEDRLIDALQPPYNRRSRSPRRGWWLHPPTKDGGRPRVHREPRGSALGPFRTTSDARDAWALLAAHTPASRLTEEWEDFVAGHTTAPLDALVAAVGELGAAGAFERAARLRDRSRHIVETVESLQQLSPTANCAELVLAQWSAQRTWHVAVVRYGRLAGSGVVPRGAAPQPVIDAIVASSATITPAPGPLAGATAAQIRHVHRFIDRAPTRIVSCTGDWSWPAGGARSLSRWASAAAEAAQAAALSEAS